VRFRHGRQEEEKNMKKLLVCIMVAGLLSGISATAAAAVPDDVVAESRNGRQLIVKTYTLGADEDPKALIEDPFEKEGFSYAFDSIVKEETPFELKKQHSETVTVETESDDLSAILEKLEPTIPYDDGEYSGALALDHTSLKTEATGYSTKSYTVTETKTIEGLDRNDPGYVPKTTVKNGRTLNLDNVEWSVQGTSLADDALVPTQYMAVATYSAHASYQAANGYITTAVYSGEIISAGIASITYTVTYYGTPIPTHTPAPTPELTPEPTPIPAPQTDPGYLYFIVGGLVLLAAGAAAVIFLMERTNVKIYAMSADGTEYELLGRQKITVSKPGIDLRLLAKYPVSEAIIEINRGTARRLFGKLVKIRLRGSVVSHMVEQSAGQNYLITVSTVEEGPQ
jgi:hypothetical protein